MWNAGKEAVADLATASASAGKTSDKQRADAPDAGIGRRTFMSAATAGMLTAWLPAFRVSPSSAQATCAPPPNFPSTIALYQEAYENWSQEIRYAGEFSSRLSGVIGLFALGQEVKSDPVTIEESGTATWRFSQSTTIAWPCAR